MSTNHGSTGSSEPPAELAEAIGRIASNWAALEFVLDMFVAVFFHMAGGSQKLPTIPISSLKQKSDMMKACLRDFPPLAPYRDKARGLLSRIHHLSNDRNFVLHGMLWTDVPDSAGPL